MMSPPRKGPTIALPWCSIELTHRSLDALDTWEGIVPKGMPVMIPSLPGDRLDELLDLMVALHRRGLRPVPHIAARRHRSRQTLALLLKRAVEVAAVDQIFLVAGDESAASGPFDSAACVIASGLIECYGITRVGIAGYPDGHRSVSGRRLAAELWNKCASLAARGIAVSITTQWSLRPDAVVAWVASVRNAGIGVPIRLSVPGPATRDQLYRHAAMIGCTDGDQVKAVSFKHCAAEVPGQLSRQLPATMRHSIGLHVLCFGGSVEGAGWLAG